jgi:hypothetical protein
MLHLSNVLILNSTKFFSFLCYFLLPSFVFFISKYPIKVFRYYLVHIALHHSSFMTIYIRARYCKIQDTEIVVKWSKSQHNRYHSLELNYTNRKQCSLVLPLNLRTVLERFHCMRLSWLETVTSFRPICVKEVIADGLTSRTILPRCLSTLHL